VIKTLADTKHVPVWMTNMHLTHVPRHVRRRKRHFEARSDTARMHSLHIIHEDRHPHALVLIVVTIRAKRVWKRAPAAAALSVQAQEDRKFVSPHAAEIRRGPPLKALFPPKLFKPGSRLLDTRDIEDGVHSADLHRDPPSITQIRWKFFSISRLVSRSITGRPC